MLAKVLGSAIANATENEKADADKLVVTQGVHRRRPGARSAGWRARWAAQPINARTSHVTVVVDVPE